MNILHMYTSIKLVSTQEYLTPYGLSGIQAISIQCTNTKALANFLDILQQRIDLYLHKWTLLTLNRLNVHAK